jgi:hypothetical protein
MGIREDDDISLLSDGTGLRESFDFHASPLRNVVMHQQKPIMQHYGTGISTSSSVASRSSINSNERRAGKIVKGARPGAKPAFQREFLAP